MQNSREYIKPVSWIDSKQAPLYTRLMLEYKCLGLEELVIALYNETNKLKENMLQPYMQPEYQVKLSDPRAMPLRAHTTDAGADLFSVERIMVYPNTFELVDTGVAIKIPSGYVGLVYSRSGMGKIRVSLTNSVGVIDSSYRGNIKVMILNEGDEPYEINPFTTRIAQLVITPIVLARFTAWDEWSEWEDTTRGSNGFGSTK